MNIENKTKISIIIIIYIGTLIWGYNSYLVPVWGYFNLESKPNLSVNDVFFIYLFSLTPLIFLKYILTRPSFFAQWILYFLLYIPMVLGVWLDPRFENAFIISLIYLLSFYLQNIFNNKKIIEFRIKKISLKYFWPFFVALTILLTFYVIFVYRDNFSFTNILDSEEIYSFREQGREIENSYLLIGYIIMGLAGASFPLLIIKGLVDKQKLNVICGVVGLIILYMTMAHKGYIISIFYIYGIYKLLSMKNENKLYILLSALTFLTFTIVFFQSEFNPFPLMYDISFVIAGLFLLRTIYTGTFMSIYYNKFFENHPYTYYSHISGINKVIDYPYKNSLGLEVGSYMSGFEKLNANANYLLTDGLAAMGYLGILISGLMLGYVFYIYDCSSKGHDIRITTTTLALVATTLINISLFTTLISGGLLFLILFFFYTKNVSKKI